LWLHSLKVAQLLRSAACLHTNQSRSYLNHLVVVAIGLLYVHFRLVTWTFLSFSNRILLLIFYSIQVST